jgi:hypothetical protein
MEAVTEFKQREKDRNGRDTQGRFLPGNKLAVGNRGGGRPPKDREARFYEILTTACTYKEWREIVKTAVAQAKGGDKDARKFLAHYLIGPPVQKVAMSTVNWDEIRIDWGDNHNETGAGEDE